MGAFTVHKIGVVCLLSIAILLGGCFPISIKRNEAPAIRGHVQHAGREDEIGVLVLAIMQETSYFSTSPHRFVVRQVDSPIFITEAQLNELNAKLSGSAFDVLFFTYFGFSFVVTNDRRVVEVCVIWPDGRYLALGDARDNKWLRETRGSMTTPWRDNIIEALSVKELLDTASPAGGCPYEEAQLGWDNYSRQRSIEYLKRVAVTEDKNKNPSGQTP